MFAFFTSEPITEKKKQTLNLARQTFTPHQPIQPEAHLSGRTVEIGNIINHLATPGEHVLLYGERGVGKTSLANVAAYLLTVEYGLKTYKIICDRQTTFFNLAYPLLELAGYNPGIVSSQESTSTKGEGGIALPVIKAGIESTASSSTTLSGIREQANSPSWVAKTIKDLQGVYIIDEFDAPQNTDEEFGKIAEFIKHLSDHASPLKILIVGVASTPKELTRGHPSLQRCLHAVPLGTMPDEELIDIILAGQKKLGITFSKEAIISIVRASSGYPHFTHLLALKCVEHAVENEQDLIEAATVEVASQRAMEDAEATLRDAYNEATRSAATDIYRKILLAASFFGVEEFTAVQLRSSYLRTHGSSISQNELNNYLGRLMSTDNSKILRRLRKGVYKFSDPRMPSFVRIAQQHFI